MLEFDCSNSTGQKLREIIKIAIIASSELVAVFLFVQRDFSDFCKFVVFFRVPFLINDSKFEFWRKCQFSLIISIIVFPHDMVLTN